MASILILSKQGDGVPIALRLASERHKVDIFIKEPKYRKSLSGYDNPMVVTKVGEADYDLILSDMVGLGAACDKLKEKGRLVLGGGKINDRLELDRAYGIKVVEKLTKLKVPASKEIKSKGELLTEIQRSTVPLVVKPLNNSPVYLTLIGVDNRNKSLLSIAKEWGDELVPCILQEKIDGFEISTEGWFDGERFVKPFNHTLEKKRLMEGDKGPQTGCMGNTVWLTNGDALTEMALIPLELFLARANYCGPIDVNCILNSDGVYFLEFTTRFGYDAIQALAELLKIGLYDFFYKVVTRQGDFIEREEYINAIAIAVRMSIPPYPNSEDVDEWDGIQVLDIEAPARRHLWLSDVKKINSKEVLAGLDGVIGCATASGDTIRECKRRVYRTVNSVVINPDVQYRNDIGSRFEEIKAKFDRWCEHASSK